MKMNQRVRGSVFVGCLLAWVTSVVLQYPGCSIVGNDQKVSLSVCHSLSLSLFLSIYISLSLSHSLSMSLSFFLFLSLTLSHSLSL